MGVSPIMMTSTVPKYRPAVVNMVAAVAPSAPEGGPRERGGA